MKIPINSAHYTILKLVAGVGFFLACVGLIGFAIAFAVKVWAWAGGQ